MVVEFSMLAIAAALPWTLLVRRMAAGESPPSGAHLQDRKHAIHESLRDLQFDFRTGKLSDADYQAGKLSLRAELAAVLVQIREAPAEKKGSCSRCGEKFTHPMKFCGNCGAARA